MIGRLSELGKYFKFILGGGLGLGVNLAVTYALSEIIGVWFRIAYAIGLGVNVIFNFYYHRRVTFNRTDSAARRFYRFVPLTLAITATNYILVLIFTELVILNWLLVFEFAKPLYKYGVIVGVTGVVSLINYYVNKRWVFK